ncbi:hypothetical protein HYH02_003243 [Chlamydomonas schloesseri]|uniref:F-box domain-containing protein n=1 Tax=Chlamydomonas schloesseri TaxID=2026947 RepID=A0A836B9Z6_9CHLO|nr:hypothetical protein HYH02_003243 [Chlamydomonas schloesseri]|eukprot:KAG2452212.1 hypothetical protein HYH02_003243 [Chlamydomonas schloesseri]
MVAAEENVGSLGGSLADVTERLAGVGLAEGVSTCQLEAPAPTGPCPPLPANVLSLIGRHLTLEERLLAGGACKAWRSGLHEAITLLEYQLDDGSCAEARRHTCQGWAALLAAAGAAASPITAIRARVGLSGNLTTSNSVSVLVAGLASHSHLQHLSVLQAPHNSGHTLPARTRAEGGRLRRRARWARPPFTVFPSISSREMHCLCSRLSRLVSLSLRECIFLAGFDSWLHDLRSLQRLELVPTQEAVCQHVRSPDKRGRVRLRTAGGNQGIRRAG